MDDASLGRRNRFDACPYVNCDDAECASRFRLGRIDQAFSVCFGAYHACPMYHRLSRSEERRRVAEAPLVEITVREHAFELPLRATGT